MALFICDRCDSIESTLCAPSYWERVMHDAFEVLCAQCESQQPWSLRSPKLKATEETVRARPRTFIYAGRFEELRLRLATQRVPLRQ